MQIQGLQPTHVAQSVSRTHTDQGGNTAQIASKVSVAATDELELSAEAQQISQIQATGSSDSVSSGIRTEKVAALRQAIAAGTYETPENLSAALDKLLDTFA
jgi:negative regulator of flagellin synthesis FlgM